MPSATAPTYNQQAAAGVTKPVDGVLRQLFKNADFLGIVRWQGAYKPGIVFSADREPLIGRGFRHKIFHIAVLAPANSSGCERPLLEGGPTAFLSAPSQPSLAPARRIHMRRSNIITSCGAIQHTAVSTCNSQFVSVVTGCRRAVPHGFAGLRLRGPPQRATVPLLQKPPVVRQRAKGVRFRAEARIGGALPGCRAARGSGSADQLLVVIETKLGFFSSINAKQPAVSTRGNSLLH